MNILEYNKIVENQSDRLFRFAIKWFKDSDRANDVVQDSFERLWKRREEVEIEKAAAYLFKTAHNLMVDMKRKDKRESYTDEMPDVQSVNHEYSDLKEVLNRALGQLPEKYRSIILLRDYEGYSYKEIGDILECTEAQVKINIYRARVALKEFIGTIDVLI